MAHPLFWPGTKYFYAIGNTPAVCLTRDLPPEQPASILLLGCGYPRNILFTIWNEPDSVIYPNVKSRSLDFTCCDVDPGVCSRNLLLLSMIIEEVPAKTMWNIFYHVYLDQPSYQVLIKTTGNLVECTSSAKAWSNSKYGELIKFPTEYTRREIRRTLNLWLKMHSLPPSRLNRIKRDMATHATETIRKNGNAMGSHRSSGPLILDHLPLALKHYQYFWRNGTVATNDSEALKNARETGTLNPTFVYSFLGEGPYLHYGTDPLSGFHLATCYENPRKSPTIFDLGDAARAEFTRWINAFSRARDSKAPLVIRLTLGDALNFCGALELYAIKKACKTPLPVCAWRTEFFELDQSEYSGSSRSAPSVFNVIDTSNLDDHIGLLNVLASALPLLDRKNGFVLYTEALLRYGEQKEDIASVFWDRLFIDIDTFGVLFDIAPVDYISGFSSLCNAGELILDTICGTKDAIITQFRQMISWKSPREQSQHELVPTKVVIDPQDLGFVLHTWYENMFAGEDALSKLFAGFRRDTLFERERHYGRQTFTTLLRYLRGHLPLSVEQWAAAVNQFHSIHDRGSRNAMDATYSHEMMAQLMLDGFQAPTTFDYTRKAAEVLHVLKTETDVVQIIATFERSSLKVLEECRSTPPLMAFIQGEWSYNAYTSTHAAFGVATAKPSITIKEDPLGWQGEGPLTLSFYVPTSVLTEVEHPSKLRVVLGIGSTPSTSFQFIPKLGMSMQICSKSLLDSTSVSIRPVRDFRFPRPQHVSPLQHPPIIGPIGRVEEVRLGVAFDGPSAKITSIIVKIMVNTERGIDLFKTQKKSPVFKQLSACVIQCSIYDLHQLLALPYPVQLRPSFEVKLARQSLWIELRVPLRSSAAHTSNFSNAHFPLKRITQQLYNIHRINLSVLPSVAVKSPKWLSSWFNVHISVQMTVRERLLLQSKSTQDHLTLVKETICALFMHSTGMKQGSAARIFNIINKSTESSEMLVLVNDIKHDLSGQTLVLEAYIMCSASESFVTVAQEFYRRFDQNVCTVFITPEESLAWQNLLPVLAERCRIGWEHKSSCKYNNLVGSSLTEADYQLGLCGCGMGKDVDAVVGKPDWKPLAPHLTKIAISPLFGVCYLERVLPFDQDALAEVDHDQCNFCKGPGLPNLKTCSQCKIVRYCSEKCQRQDWKVHKKACSQFST